jgi:hypothetical protein
VDPIVIAVNDLGEPDARNTPVRFDEGGDCVPLLYNNLPVSTAVPPSLKRIFEAFLLADSRGRAPDTRLGPLGTTHDRSK